MLVGMTVALVALIATPSMPVQPPIAVAAGALSLDLVPETATARTGVTHTITAHVRDADGIGFPGVEVDVEIVGGAADDDAGTAGDTPAIPDLSCTTSGGGVGTAATCSVSYTDDDNDGGGDAVRGWIDLDGNDATTEADAGEGRSTGAASAPGCSASSTGDGDHPEPDGTDCVAMTWTARQATYVDLDPEDGSGAVGGTVTLTALVYDQDGNPFTGAGTSTHVRVFFATGSPNDIDSPGNSPDLDCHTGSSGACQVSYVAAVGGTDTICALIGGPTSQCVEAVDAAEMDDRVDVVEHTSTAGGPTPTPSPAPTPTPTPVPTPSPTPTSDPTPTPTPTPTPVPTPSPTPTPDPTTEPTPTPTPTSDPTPAPDPTATPTDIPAPESTATPTTTPTVVPDPSPTPTLTPTAAPGIGAAGTTSGSGQSGTPGPAEGAAPTERGTGVPVLEAILEAPIVGTIVRAVTDQVRATVKPAAVAAVATTFTFPLLLMVIVLGFLVVQGRMDGRDPKLRNAPMTTAETTIPFADEADL